MSRIVSWFSCGAASAVATKLAIAEHKDITIARCVVREEHPDNERFAVDCEKWFGLPVTNLINEKFDGSIYEVFKQRSYISGIHGAPCTLVLKKHLRQEFERPDDIQVFGYTADKEDMERWDRFLDANNIHAIAPLIDRGITHAECLAIVQDAGIKLPTMYKLGYKHNNCVGCCKATGSGYWNKVRVDFPEAFDRMAKESRRLNARMIRDESGNRKFLDEITEGAGNYQTEPEIQCGIFCEMAKNEIG